MHRFLMALACAFLSASFTFAQEPWANKLFADGLAHDFGVIKPGDQLKHTFKMTNIYKVPLDITNIKVSCGCVTVEPSARSVAPRDSITLNVLMDTRKLDEPIAARIYVTVGPRDVSTAVLTVHANPRGDVVLSPRTIDFGSVARGQSPTKIIDVEYVGKSKEWRVEEIRNPTPSPCTLKADYLPNTETGLPRKGFRISATLKPDVATGSFKHTVTIKTNDKVMPMISFDISGSVQGALTLSQDFVTFAETLVGETQTKKVIVRGATPFRILKVEGAADPISVVPGTESAATHVLTINFRPKQAGDWKQQLVIRTDLADSTVELTIAGRATKE